MSRTFGVPGESARQQAERRRNRRKQLERQEQNWDGGAVGEESTAEAIDKRCPQAVSLHDRRMPDSRANIDHIVLVPSGVWVIDSKRMNGRIKVEDAKDGTQKLVINGKNQTELVHKLTWQLSAVESMMAALDPHVPVHGAFCFWLPIEKLRDLFDPRVEDNGLPVFRTWTINGYPLFHPRQMTRRLNSAGTLSATRAEQLASALAECFPSALRSAVAASAATAVPQARASVIPPTATVAVDEAVPPPARLSKEEFKIAKEAEQERVWEQQRVMIEDAMGCAVPRLLSERLSKDGAVWCHPALWHSRVYLACVHGNVGHTFSYKQAASVVATHHDGRPGPPQWRALTAFLEHLRAQGYVRFTPSVEGRLDEVAVIADLRHPTKR